MNPNENATPRTSPALKITLAVSLLALAGVIFVMLTYRQPAAGNSGSTGTGVPKDTDRNMTEGTRIAFVRADSVQNNYLMTMHFLDSIEKKFRSMEGDLVRKKQSYQKRVESFYRDAQSGLLPESTALKMEANFQKEGNEISELEDNYTGRINDLQLKLNIIYFDSLWNFLDRRKGEMGFDMVVGYQQGLTNIFFADSSMDITHQVIELMNKEYLDRYPQRKNLKKSAK